MTQSVGYLHNPTTPTFPNGVESYDSDTLMGLCLSSDEENRVNESMVSAFAIPGVQDIIGELQDCDDQFTIEHSDRVGYVATSLVVRTEKITGIPVDPEILVYTSMAGYTHDGGKKYRQREVHQPRRLKDFEFCDIKDHAPYSARLAKAARLPEIVQVGDGNHHGYQRGAYAAFPERLWTPRTIGRLSAEHLVGTAIAAADVFDASRSVRPERSKPRSIQESLSWVDGLNIPPSIKRSMRSLYYSGSDPNVLAA